jgi:putative nucleotidyltransferase with HDIG domain
MMPDYKESLALFHEWTESESLRRHAYAVEAAMGYYAEKYGEDVEKWRITGLLHDMDYERHPTQEEHPFVGVGKLKELGYPEDVTTAILGHAAYSGVSRETRLAKTLFAVDELAGLITAIGYVRPNGLQDLSVKSVRKKLKDKAFAAAVSREDIQLGADELGIDLSEHIANVAAGMSREAERLGF